MKTTIYCGWLGFIPGLQGCQSIQISIDIAHFSSVAQSCPTVYDPMNCSTPGLPVHHQLRELTQTHVRQVSDAIQPSHPLLSPSPPAPRPSQHQGLFQWVNSSHEVAKVLEFQLQHQSLQWTPRTDLLQNGLVGSPCSPRDSQESSPSPQFKSINFLALSFLHHPTLTSIHDHWKNHSLDMSWNFSIWKLKAKQWLPHGQHVANSVCSLQALWQQDEGWHPEEET